MNASSPQSDPHADRGDETPSGVRRGRKRDPALDVAILDATLAVLAERGYDGLTIDLVAARAGSARATVYRRWPAKVDLVLDAVAWLSRGDVDRAQLPDTGSLRGDMTAMIITFDDDGQQLRMQAMAALLAVPRDDARLADSAQATGLAPWVAVNRELIARAVERGEFPPPADLDALAELIPTMCIARAAQRLALTEEFVVRLIDGVLLPALRGGPSTSRPARAAFDSYRHHQPCIGHDDSSRPGPPTKGETP